MRKTKKNRLIVNGVRPFMVFYDYEGTCLTCNKFIHYPGRITIFPVGRKSETCILGVALEMLACPYCKTPYFFMDLYDRDATKENKQETISVVEDPTETEYVEELIEIIDKGIKEIDEQEDESSEA